MKIIKHLSAIALGLALLVPSSANAALILDTASLTPNGSYTLGNFSTDQDPLGQTFTLTGNTNNIQIGGVLSDVNDFLNPTLDIIISLVTGAGTGGTLLGSSAFTLPDGFGPLLHMEDFSFLGTLSAGTYTALFSSGATGRGALGVSPTGGDSTSDPYNENGIFTIHSDSTKDFLVRVTGDAVISGNSVPEPAPLALLGLGLLGLGLARRRKV